MRCTLSRYVRMVMTAQDVGSAVQWVMANPPTPLGVAVDLSDTGIDADTDRTDEGRLAEVRSEAGPEVVVQVRPSVECAGVECQPMSQGTEEPNEERDTHHKKNEEEDKSQGPRMSPVPGLCDRGRPDAGSIWGQRGRQFRVCRTRGRGFRHCRLSLRCGRSSRVETSEPFLSDTQPPTSASPAPNSTGPQLNPF
jgi:hypothetical protein